MTAVYFHLAKQNDRDVILSSDSDLKITVYRLQDEDFKSDGQSPVIYGDDHGDYLAFEVSFEDSTPEEITDAIKWYAKYLDYPEMDIQLQDPRP